MAEGQAIELTEEEIDVLVEWAEAWVEKPMLASFIGDLLTAALGGGKDAKPSIEKAESEMQKRRLRTISLQAKLLRLRDAIAVRKVIG